MTIIGLTGTMGSGKSTGSAILRSKGYYVFDSDEMSRKLTEKGSPVLDIIAERFGEEMIGEDGELDRRKLAAVVFSDQEEKAALQRIVTDRVCERIRELTDELRSGAADDERPAVFFDVPLLFECGLDSCMDQNWCVTADDETRIKRIMKRDGITREEILARFRN